ncbi:beta-lactamase family protein [Marivirga sp. S37H4]|uniref:Beta-lactamase family protein n=1 Tax=Marivirga aurantiaca TaxID=2802615 RepID=A0A934WZ44_9BACT|nr:serine hydrolase domain-containing protein [Marivirga aurantiaca]MBK6265669.1 beta-lactamase family protein [Marivirga aurantiaca]
MNDTPNFTYQSIAINTQHSVSFIKSISELSLKKFLILLLILTSSIPLFSQHQHSFHIPDSDSIKVWLKNNNVASIGIGTIEDGKLNKIIVQGKLSPDKDAPFNAIYDVASLTKSITTYLTLRLVSDGNWDLDEPLANYWVDPEVSTDPRHKLLTSRHVLSHQTGFKNWRWQHSSKKLTFDFEPGSKFQYSGEGFEYLRRALERKFDTSLENLCDSLVFTPFGMKDSHLVWNKEIDSTRLALGHDASNQPYDYEPSLQANAADNLLTTIEDFGIFGVGVMEAQGLTSEVFDQMITQHSEVRDKVGFGLGWIVFNNLPNDEYALFNAGSDEGVNAIILLLPKSKRGLIVMTNGDNGRSLAMKILAKSSEVGMEILKRF